MQEPTDLYERLRARDEATFRSLVRQLQRSMIAVAAGFVGSRATAEEVVQDTWLAVIEGIERFEGRASLKNWIFAILANKARTRAVREGRTIPVADLGRETGGDEAAVDPSRFDSNGSWIALPALWDEVTPERIVAGRQMWAHVSEAVERLPPAQRAVLVLRQAENMDSAAVRAILGIAEGNQRVLLHRARRRIREHLEKVLGA